MNAEDLIAKLRSTPDDNANVEAAQAWLAIQQEYSTEIDAVLIALIKHRPEQSTYEWLSLWLQTRDWYSLTPLVINTGNVELHEWLTQFASENPFRPKISALWQRLLMDYKYKWLIDAASNWLIKYGDGEEAAMVSLQLLPMTKDRKAQQRAIILLREFSDESHIASLIEHVGDQESIDLGYAIINETCSPAAEYVARALMKNDASRHWTYVERWLFQRWNDEYLDSTLSFLMCESPDLVAPLTFRWIEEHPKATKVSRIFSLTMALSPSQQLLDEIWKWLESRTHNSYGPDLLAVLVQHWGKLRTPPAAIRFIDRWLKDNLNHPQFQYILPGALREENTGFRVELARQWLDQRPDAARGHMLMNLRRRCPAFFTSDALSWAERYHELSTSQIIKFEHFQDNRDKAVVTMEQIKKFVSPSLFPVDYLCELVRLGDTSAIAKAKAELTVKLVEENTIVNLLDAYECHCSPPSSKRCQAIQK